MSESVARTSAPLSASNESNVISRTSSSVASNGPGWYVKRRLSVLTRMAARVNGAVLALMPLPSGSSCNSSFCHAPVPGSRKSMSKCSAVTPWKGWKRNE